MKENTASRLKFIMDTRKLKQSDIVSMAQPYCTKYGVKLGKSDLSQFVNGKANPGQWKLTILGMALNVSESWLMGFDVPMERNISSTPPDFSNNLSTLSESETSLIYSFRNLNQEGQEKVLSYCDDLNRAGIYKNDYQPDMVQKQA